MTSNSSKHGNNCWGLPLGEIRPEMPWLPQRTKYRLFSTARKHPMLKCCRKAMSELNDIPLVKQTSKSAPWRVIWRESLGYISSQHNKAPTDIPLTSPIGEACSPLDNFTSSSSLVSAASQSSSQGNTSAKGAYSPPAISSILSCRPTSCSFGSKRNAETNFSSIFGRCGNPGLACSVG